MKKFNFKIGSDPELNLATNVLNTVHVGSDGILGSHIRHEVTGGTFDTDHSGEVLELNPDPSDKPKMHVENIGKMIKHIHDKMPILDLVTQTSKGWHAGGGHVHLEIPDDMVNDFIKLNDAYVGDILDIPEDDLAADQHGSYLKHKIQSVFGPLSMIIMEGENRRSLLNRLDGRYTNSSGEYGAAPKYGFITGLRVFNSDEHSTYELRAPSAEWLTTPKIAECTLAFCGVVWHEILHHYKELAVKMKGMAYTNKEHGRSMQKLLLSSTDDTMVRPTMNKLKAVVRSMELYPEWKDEINYIMNSKQVLKDKVKHDFNPIFGWGLEQKGYIPSKRKMGKKFVFDYLQKNMSSNDTLIESIPVQSGSNATNFTKELVEHMARMGFRTRNDYYLSQITRPIPTVMAFTRNPKGTQVNLKLYWGKSMMKTKADYSEIRLAAKAVWTSSYKERIFISVPKWMIKSNDMSKVLEVISAIERGKVKPLDMKSEVGDNLPVVPTAPKGAFMSFKAVSHDLIGTMNTAWKPSTITVQ